jgi:transposase
LLVSDADRDVLRSWTRSTALPAGLAVRARIVLAAADGESNTSIAGRLGITRQTVVSWRARYVAGGLRALEDRSRSGRPRVVDPLEVVVATMQGPPKRLGITHWSSRLLAAELGISGACP